MIFEYLTQIFKPTEHAASFKMEFFFSDRENNLQRSFFNKSTHMIQC